jgi:hypothetical protein
MTDKKAILVIGAGDATSFSLARRGIFSRRAQELGAGLHDQRERGAHWPQRRQPGLGGTGQYVLLDRPTLNIAGLAMMQALPFVDPRTLDVFYGFERSVYTSLS